MAFDDLTAIVRERLPDLKGPVTANASMKPFSWFRTGGPAQLLFEPADEADLVAFLEKIPADWPVMPVGLGSNLLVRDGGIPGVVIKLGKTFGEIEILPDHLVRAGAGAPDVKVARAAAEAGIAGFAFLRGIPGAIGGALRMNGGAYGGEVTDVLVEARAVRRDGRVAVLDHAAMGFGYRHSAAPEDAIFVSALFRGMPGDPAALLAAMDEITRQRSATQPVNTRTGGSTFRNPPGHSAWKLVDQAGCRGLRIGGAQVSELHTNFLIASPGATSADIEELGETVRARVKAASGIELHWEIKRVGLKGPVAERQGRTP
ncbi:UDP-N-acetylmuramate dehydrogenase [Phreatobacter sp. AB_2022a]|uniref:UDP-N-acetylmuramate dehydrogenase n=1 Tax=Phreatobacter sp. AB_2022a TaxID=3003134 RepID=UPI0022875946|nr:UDP-N-acetylmuramate dehydrogenase [Phreatobacter sp. AB_2022a]MCZ0738475.1 UDP-N-acetylmuramate dehydrogenase [Phreatobacter sp. AB_2022a]